MKKGLILTLAAAAIMGMGASPLHAETGSGSLQPVQNQMIAQCEDTFENAPTLPQDDNVELISGCVIVVGAEHWKENVQDIYEFIGITPQAEWEEFETEGQLCYNKKEYSSDGKNRYDVIVIPFSDRYAGVMFRVFGVKQSRPDHEDFVVPDTSNKTMAGMCAFMLFPRDDHEQWEYEFWDACELLGVDIMSDWDEYETEYSQTYRRTGFDEKRETMYDIIMVPPIDEDDLCAVMITKWAL